MLKQVYELNLPPIDELFIDSFQLYDDAHLKHNFIGEENLSTVIKQEWHTFNNYQWNLLMYFKKSNIVGHIHTDINTWPEVTDLTVWGINWCYDDTRTMQYWDWNHVSHIGETESFTNNTNTGSVVPTKGIAPKFNPNTDPDETYYLLPNKAYLVCTSLPHRAIGQGLGRAFSYRSTTHNLEWNKVVESFQQYIV
jgi:hypothetical protein